MSEEHKSLRILIVDDHAIVRAGLRSVLELEDDMTIVGEASSAGQAIAMAHTLAPDVILMDIRMGEGDNASGIDACREIRSERPGTQVIMFTSYTERESVLASIMAGATGFLTKNVSHERLVEAVRLAGRGQTLLDPAVARGVIDKLTELGRAAVGPADILSARESEILVLVAQGYTNKEIAARLVISPLTARNHVVHILDKLGLSSRSEAAAQAVRLGLMGDA